MKYTVAKSRFSRKVKTWGTLKSPDIVSTDKEWQLKQMLYGLKTSWVVPGRTSLQFLDTVTTLAPICPFVGAA
jgi:hypothetical protein